MNYLNVREDLKKNCIRIDHSVYDKFHTHIIETSEGGHIKVELCHLNDYINFYRYVYEHKTSLKIMCNPGAIRSRRLYFDLDGDKDDIKLDSGDCNQLLNLFEATCNNLFGPADCIRMCKNKTSEQNYHAVYNRKTPKNGHLYQKLVISKMKENLDEYAKNCAGIQDDSEYIGRRKWVEKMKKAIDGSVGIRALYSPKINDKNNYYILMNQDRANNISDWVDQCIIADPTYTDKYELIDNIDNIKEEIKNIKKQIKKKSNLWANEQDWIESGKSHKDSKIISKIKNLSYGALSNNWIWKLLLASVKSYFTKDTKFNKRLIKAFDEVSKYGKGYDLAKNKIHYKNSSVRTDGDKLIEKYQFDKNWRKKNKSSPKRAAPKTKQDKINMREQSLVNCLTRVHNEGKYEPLRESKQVCLRYYNIPIESNCNTAIRSPTGTGKTYNLKKFIRANKNKRYIFIGQRVALLRALEQEMKEFGFVFYQDIKGRKEWNKIDSILIQMESIHKIPADVIETFDYIIMDEFVSVMNQLSSPNFTNSRKAFINLSKLFKSNGYVICMDAYLSDDYLDKFSAEFGRTFKKYDNCYKNKSNEFAHILQDEGQIIDILKGHIKRGHKIIVCSDTKSFCDRIESIFIAAKYKLLYINSDNSQTKHSRKILANINKEIIQYNAFVYSPSIENGISINVKHFDVQFNHFTYSQTNFQSNLQMINRVRHKNFGLNYIFLNKPRIRPVTQEAFKNYYEARGYDVEEIHNTPSLIKINIVPMDDRFKLILESSLMKLIIFTESAKTYYNYDHSYNFLKNLHHQGYKISIERKYDLQKYESFQAEIKEISNTAKNMKIEKIIQADLKNGDSEAQPCKIKEAMINTYKIPEKEINQEIVKKAGSWENITRFKRRAAYVCGNDINKDKKLNDNQEENEYDEIWRRLFDAGINENHYKIGSYILDNFKDWRETFDRAALENKLNNIWAGFSDINKVIHMFVKTRKSFILTEMKFAQKILYTNKVLEKVFDLKLQRINHRSKIYQIKSRGFNPDDYSKYSDLDIFDEYDSEKTRDYNLYKIPQIEYRS